MWLIIEEKLFPELIANKINEKLFILFLSKVWDKSYSVLKNSENKIKAEK